jgi:hypothetical protein
MEYVCGDATTQRQVALIQNVRICVVNTPGFRALSNANKNAAMTLRN